MAERKNGGNRKKNVGTIRKIGKKRKNFTSPQTSAPKRQMFVLILQCKQKQNTLRLMKYYKLNINDHGMRIGFIYATKEALTTRLNRALDRAKELNKEVKDMIYTEGEKEDLLVVNF